ncbi:Por secretion system C-terminal sorting domain-containing protein [Dyadobacter sp. SG02]|uniref:T9SS type A sorting domain-containing protein n=1 Tax=Dyadobacter sp. SG02 TaxID=1855291 RepID=UPI0008B8DA38|nr:T9SS type A sorting domain-containing protein [Dyadobacter sp. SG02]SEJ20008.1 Por secretion system C-terminal sorting domain-containing protein [Dyadobacter sp. SG02]
MKKIFLSIALAITGLVAQAQNTGAKPAPQGFCQPINKQMSHAGIGGLVSKCPGTDADLSIILPSFHSKPSPGYMQLPVGWKYVFFTNNTHTGQPIPSLKVGVGKYYLFGYNPATGCYNTDLSTVSVDVYCCNVPNASVPLLTDNAQIPCNASTIPNLNAYLAPYNLPPDVKVTWSKYPTAGVQGMNMKPDEVSPLNAPPGKYYAFFESTSGGLCYYQNASNIGTPLTITKLNCATDAQLVPENSDLWINKVEFDNNAQFTLFPNPVSDELSFKNSESLKNIVKTTLYNNQGTEVYQSGADPLQKINVKHLPTGVYVLKVVEKSNKASNHRILIAR